MDGEWLRSRNAPRILLQAFGMPLLFRRHKEKASSEVGPTADGLHLLSGYVLHMSITSLGDGDITPLYEEYMNDPRLGPFERKELTIAFRTLRERRSLGLGSA